MRRRLLKSQFLLQWGASSGFQGSLANETAGDQVPIQSLEQQTNEREQKQTEEGGLRKHPTEGETGSSITASSSEVHKQYGPGEMEDRKGLGT